MKKHLFSLSFTLLLSLFGQSAIAAVAGLNLSTDGPSLHFQRQYEGETPAWAQKWLKLQKHEQRISLVHSSESYARNQVIDASVTWQQINLLNGPRTLRPVANVYFGNLFSEKLLSLGGGLALTSPKSHNGPIPLDIRTALSFAPAITTLAQGKYLWHFTLEASIELPDNNLVKIGFRHLGGKMDNTPTTSFEKGLYVGLASRF